MFVERHLGTLFQFRFVSILRLIIIRKRMKLNVLVLVFQPAKFLYKSVFVQRSFV